MSLSIIQWILKPAGIYICQQNNEKDTFYFAFYEASDGQNIKALHESEQHQA